MELKQASWDLVPDLVAILRKNYPSTKTACNYLIEYDKTRRTHRDIGYELLTPAGLVDEYATFVITVSGTQNGLIIETLNPDLKPLTEALACTPHIDWSTDILIISLPSRLKTIVEGLKETLNISVIDCPAESVHISKEKAIALNYEIPEDCYISSLRVADAEIVNEQWPHGSGEASLPFVRDVITRRKSFALFKKDSNKPVAWTLHFEYGGCGILQVVPEEKRKGYGEVIMKAMTKYSGELGQDPHCFIVPKNVASMTLFKKVGYEPGYYASWYEVSPKK